MFWLTLVVSKDIPNLWGREKGGGEKCVTRTVRHGQNVKKVLSSFTNNAFDAH